MDQLFGGEKVLKSSLVKSRLLLDVKKARRSLYVLDLNNEFWW